MDIVEEIKNIVVKLNELEKYKEELPQKLSIQDSKEQDILHLIEYEKFTAFEAYRLLKELKKVRKERRIVKNDCELLQCFSANKNKILNESNRQFLLQDLYNKQRNLKAKYKNRQYTEEEFNKILKGLEYDKN